MHYQTTVKAIAITGLGLLVAGGFYVSYENLHTFAIEHGKGGYRAITVALSVDLLTLLGLLVALTNPSLWARVAFVVGLGATAVANGMVGWDASAYYGLAVALMPVIALELSYRIVLGLLFPNLTVKRFSSPSNRPPDPGVKLEEPSKPLQEPSNILELTPEQVAASLQKAGGPLPSRAEVSKIYGLSDWKARQALKLANAS